VRTANPFRFRTVPVGLSLRKIALDVCLLLTVLRLARKNNYVCLHGVEEGAGLALLCKALFGIPVIYDMQSSLPEQLRHVRGFVWGLGRWLSLMFERWLIKSANFIIASRGLAQRVQSIQPGKTVWECAFAGSNPRQKNEHLAEHLGILGRPTVVYTGNFAPHQGLGELIEAAKIVYSEIPEVVFLLVGGTEGELNHLARMVEKGGLNDTVQLISRQPRREIPNYLALADILILARINGENVPLKIYDYLKSEKPIVATDIPAHRAVLSDETAILVAPQAKALADGIILALKNHSHAKKIAAAALSLAEADTSIPLEDTIAEAYLLVTGIDLSLRRSAT
jgi:glycosyltransferase involved in cell wall biosynthesis